MKNKNIKMVSDIYWVMLDLKNNYNSDVNLRTIDLQEYIRKEFLKLTEEAMIWLADDEREKQNLDLD